MKDWKYYLLIIPFYILVAPFVAICLLTEFWIIMMTGLRLLAIVPLYSIMGVASIFEPKLINDKLDGNTESKLAITKQVIEQVIEDEFEDSRFFLKHFLLIFREPKDV